MGIEHWQPLNALTYPVQRHQVSLPPQSSSGTYVISATFCGNVGEFICALAKRVFLTRRLGSLFPHYSSLLYQGSVLAWAAAGFLLMMQLVPSHTQEVNEDEALSFQHGQS